LISAARPQIARFHIDFRYVDAPQGEARHHRLGAGERLARGDRHRRKDANAGGARHAHHPQKSLALDLKIVALTVVRGFVSPGAY